MKDKFINQVCIVRSDRAGVFIGKVIEHDGKEVVMQDVRRLWYWDGAASIDEIAIRGVFKKENCKFPCIVGNKFISNVIEIIPATDQAIKSISEVQEWTYSQ
jgi:hypothetical protein